MVEAIALNKSPEPAALPPAELSLVPTNDPKEVLRKGHLAAKALVEIVKQRAKENKPLVIRIGESDFLRAEAWQLIAAFYGVTTRVDPPEFLSTSKGIGWKVHASAWLGEKKIADGWGAATADEPNSHGLFHAQLMGKAQTRALSRTLRHALSWVTVLAGYAPTPAEEMET